MTEMPVVDERIFPVALMGGAARRALGAGDPCAGGRAGKVLAVFRRSFYLEMPGPEGSGPIGPGHGLEKSKLVCIGPSGLVPAPGLGSAPSGPVGSGLGAGPLNALCDLPEGMAGWEEEGLRPGAAAQIRENSLIVERGSLTGGEGSLSGAGCFVFSLENAQVWRPNIPPGPPDLENILSALGALAGEAGRRAPAEGMGRLIPGIACGNLGPASGLGAAKAAGDPFLRMAAEGAEALLGWMKNSASGGGLTAPPVPPGLGPAHGPPGPPVEAEALIGLGPGLTPSGDDFIGGAMVALRSLGGEALADRLAAWALPLAEKRTGRISRAHLECAAEGEGAGALHEAIRAMGSYGEFSGGDILAGELSGCVDALDAIGHTSGWDALAGAVAGASVAVDESKTGAAP